MMKHLQELATLSMSSLSYLQAAKGMVFARVTPAILLLPGLSPVHAGCLDAVPESVLFERSEAVAKVVVLNRESWIADNGVVATRYRLKCEKIYKGEIEAEFDIVSQGGTAAGKHHFRSDFLDLQKNHSYALMLDRDRDGNWTASGLKAHRMQHGCDGHCRYLQNSARGPRPLSASPLLSAASTESESSNIGTPGSKVTTTGYSETGGQPTRFTTCDGDEPIRYLVDINPAQLPTGMNEADALAAVEESLNAWSSVSSLKFALEGTVTFEAPASSIAGDDGFLRIQLHDPFGVVGGSTLGIGGGAFNAASSTFSGGVLNGQGFQSRLYGYVVMENVTDQSSLQNPERFKRVLTHELGHALGLAHSSEDPLESEPLLKNATMYYQAIADGATLNAYDEDRIQLGYPAAQTPPTGADRVMSIVTTSASYGVFPSDVLGVNRVKLRSFDRQGDTTTFSIAAASSNAGTFTIEGDDLVYTPAGFFGGGRLSDAEIEAGFYYDFADVVFNDGINESRSVRHRVVGYHPDTSPQDGLPDDWMSVHFGTSTPGSLGSTRHPDEDPDNDGLSNRLEFCLNTDPNDPTRGPVAVSYEVESHKLTFRPTRFAPYYIESSANLESGSWQLTRILTTDQAETDVSATFNANPSDESRFFRVGTDF